MASDFTTQAAVKQQLNMTVAGDDPILGAYITRVSDFIRVYCDIDIFPVKSYTDIWEGNGLSDIVVLVNRPVVAISSVVAEAQGVVPAFTVAAGRGWSARGNILRLRGYTPGAHERVTIVYTANFATVPSEIEALTIDMVARLYRERSRIGEASKNVGGEVISFDIKNVAGAFGLEVLDHYKRRVSHTGGSFP